MRKDISIAFFLTLIMLAAGMEARAEGVTGDGVYLRMKTDGTLLTFAPLKSWNREGYWLEFQNNGDFRRQLSFDNDRLHGIAKGYYPDRTLFFERHFKNGLLDGPSRKYHPNGQLKVEMHYADNVPVGLARLYDINGELMQVNHYRAGDLKTIRMYAGGMMIKEIVYK